MIPWHSQIRYGEKLKSGSIQSLNWVPGYQRIGFVRWQLLLKVQWFPGHAQF
ncbi:hypothetical Protein YC6258_03546 [Gynuella sunshinyii YC6258]|uniref:Uncharacterized protein n=1 Tax=Gynuella sunshinyii YC6258 TaxID=1445510 RepID=A0A0C5VLJ0_9GAMM|nr:hypothetical Protein YC6258_03546 [Gynuella sunshinyii YC6258]